MKASIREDVLWKSYEVINNFCDKKLSSKKLTFFCTGVVARHAPDLIKTISNDGHEIGCHYNFHDLMYKQDLKTIEKNIIEGKDHIYNACGEEAIGFRAPVFSIPDSRIEIFDILSKYFKYDSSYVFKFDAKPHEGFEQKAPFNLCNMTEFPIIPKKYLGRFYIKSGGTFLRLFTKRVLKDVLKYNLENNFVPLIYMHPYDYLSNGEFWVSLSDFFKTKSLSALSRYPRQVQWHYLNNRSVFKKLDYVLNEFEHQGPMRQLIEGK